MIEEIKSAVDFLTKILRTRKVNEEKVETFNTTLVNLLCVHYENHWFPEKPFKGSAYRCVRIYQKMDEMIRQAGEKSGLTIKELFSYLPNELTIWIDPNEVSYRIGEDGSVGTLYEDKEAKEALKAAAKAAKVTAAAAKKAIVIQQPQQSLVSQSSTGESPHSSPSSSPPPGFNAVRTSPLRMSPVPFMPSQQQQQHHQQPPMQGHSPVSFFHQQQQYHHAQHPQRRSPTHHMQHQQQQAMRTSPQSHQYPFHHQQQYPGANTPYHQQYPGQQHRHSPVNFLQRKTPSPIMTAEDYRLHKQHQEMLQMQQEELQESSEFLQACKEQLRHYFPESGPSDSLIPEYLATTFVAS